jgi:hypothetical protein
MRLLHTSWNITGHNVAYLQTLLLLLLLLLFTYLLPLSFHPLAVVLVQTKQIRYKIYRKQTIQ